MNGKTQTDADIARKAYELWEAEGRPEGRDVAHWHQAQQDVAEPVIEPIPQSSLEDNPLPVNPATEVMATEIPADSLPKPKATRARKPKAVDAAAADGTAPAKPRAPRRRKTTPEA
ncbi:hypothetical protein HNP73_001509 [Amaricoccus macauensis]|uniref:DUF2934 domain-containing protein n=1 Tax=Amaricoccus macauensis TaxID=57001 RepID=A0A840SMU0_9RHOB|nr:DUF2934 domain-containing protein [Amaricoccus macauensis]MBB5221588.1 hypothetical protein [Amaricoccus macauensis]